MREVSLSLFKRRKQILEKTKGHITYSKVEGLEKTENFNSREGWLLNCFFLSFSNHEDDSIKNICVYSKSKIKTKVTSKPNLEILR